jgi:Na+/phosphate symporter
MVYNKWQAASSSLWVNLIYVLFVAPVLFVIGYYKKETSRLFFEATLLLAFATLGYNIYNLVLQLNTVTGDSN